MLKKIFDSVLFMVGAVTLLLISCFALAYFALPLNALIGMVGVFLGLIGFAYVVKWLKQYAKIKEVPHWLQAKNPTLYKAQKQIWTSLKG